jgi:hypothetical protein
VRKPAAAPTTLGRVPREQGHEVRLMSPELPPALGQGAEERRAAKRSPRLRRDRSCASSSSRARRSSTRRFFTEPGLAWSATVRP